MLAAHLLAVVKQKSLHRGSHVAPPSFEYRNVARGVFLCRGIHGEHAGFGEQRHFAHLLGLLHIFLKVLGIYFYLREAREPSTARRI